MTPDPAPAPRRIWPWLILAAAGATLAVIAVTAASDPAAGLDFRFNPPSETSAAKYLLDNPANGTITEPKPVTVQVERQNNRTTLRFTVDDNYFFRPDVLRGPIHRVAATDTVTLCPDHTLRILAFVVRERTRDRQAPDRIFDPAGKPMDEAAFRSQSGLASSDVISFGPAYQVTVVVQSSHTIAIPTLLLFPQNRPEWQCHTNNEGCYDERRPGTPEIHVIRTTPTYTPDGKLELLLQVYGGPTDKVPIPAKDGEQLTTPYGSIRRLVTLGEKLLNPDWKHDGKTLQYTYPAKAAGQTTLFAVSDALADHASFTRDTSTQERWTRCDRIWTQIADNPAQAEEPAAIFSRAATIRFTLPASLPCPDFRSWDPMDDPVPVNVDPNNPIVSHLVDACGIGYTAWNEISASLNEVPGAKTNRDLLRHLCRKAHAKGLTAQWEPDNRRTLGFTTPPTLKERVRDFTQTHLPWVYDRLP